MQQNREEYNLQKDDLICEQLIMIFVYDYSVMQLVNFRERSFFC